jgi:hypothetical protein
MRNTLLLNAFSSRKKTNFRNCQSELLNRAVEILVQLCLEFLETNFSPISFFNLEKTLAKLCVKIGTKTLRVNSA